MLPPLLEIYVVWHPDDAGGAEVAEGLIDHFHGTAFSGLVGGAIEVFVRSAGWAGGHDAPRPLPCVQALPHGIAEAEMTVVVPVTGRQMAVAVEDGGPWREYVRALVDVGKSNDDVLVLPVSLGSAGHEGVLHETVGHLQDVHLGENLCRDVAQMIAQFAARSDDQIKVFISHTKRAGHGDDIPSQVVERVREEILRTKLEEYFDEHNLAPGTDWSQQLIEHAASSALLAVRTDLFASRTWCQREVLTAKQSGAPAVILDALSEGEERGSFLMDNLPRVPSRAGLEAEMVARALGQLVDECLKRALWRRQQALAEREGFLTTWWWAPHAPEPITLISHLRDAADALPSTGPVLVLHPDPPLGPDELEVLEDLATLCGLEKRVEITTPRGLAIRGV